MKETVLVPREPTEEMIQAAFIGKVETQDLLGQMRRRQAMADNYRAMIAAAPAAPIAIDASEWQRVSDWVDERTVNATGAARSVLEDLRHQLDSYPPAAPIEAQGEALKEIKARLIAKHPQTDGKTSMLYYMELAEEFGQHAATLERELTNRQTRLEQERDYIRQMDRVIDDEKIARSCINPLEDLRRAVRGLKAALSAAEQAKAAAVLDAERLDWMEKRGDYAECKGSGHADDKWWILAHHDGQHTDGATFREAIDAARKEQP